MKNAEKITEYAIAITLFITGFIVYMLALTRTWMVPGIDGPYYVVQVNYLLSHGVLKYQDPPLVFYVFALLSLFVGDPFLGVKIGVSIMTALASVPVYFLFKKVTNSNIAGFTSGLIFLLAPQTFRLLGDFMKNSSGMLWLNMYIYFLYICLDRKSWRTQVIAVTFLILTGLTHILDYGIAFCYTLLFVMLALFSKISIKNVLLPFTATILSLAAFFTVPAIVGGDVFKGVAFLKDIIEQDYSKMAPLRIEWVIFSWAAMASLLVYSILSAKRGDKKAFILSLASTIVISAINLPILPRQWLFRFQLMTPIPMAHAFGFVVGDIKDEWRRLAFLLLLTGIISTIALPAFYSIRPSIPVEEYLELRHVVEKVVPSLNPNPCIVVPNARIRYWVETFQEKVYSKPTGDACSKLIFIFETRKGKLIKGKVIFKGKFIQAVTP